MKRYAATLGVVALTMAFAAPASATNPPITVGSLPSPPVQFVTSSLTVASSNDLEDVFSADVSPDNGAPCPTTPAGLGTGGLISFFPTIGWAGRTRVCVWYESLLFLGRANGEVGTAYINVQPAVSNLAMTVPAVAESDTVFAIDLTGVARSSFVVIIRGFGGDVACPPTYDASGVLLYGPGAVDGGEFGGTASFIRSSSATATGPGYVTFCGYALHDRSFMDYQTVAVARALTFITAPPDPPTWIAKPRVRGIRKVGQRLTCHAGTWAPPTPSFRYSWQRSGRTITGRHSRTYHVVRKDAGKRIRCIVTATNAAGSTRIASASLKIARRR